jgi:hypothetical protein
MNGVFIIELSATDSDEQRNVQMLKESPWFDIPIAYNNGSRAILAIEKGLPGYRAFAEAFAVWCRSHPGNVGLERTMDRADLFRWPFAKR